LAADEAAARSIVFMASDLPEGWEPGLTGSDDATTAAKLAACLHVATTVFAHGPGVAFAASPNFEVNSGETAVHDSVTIGASDAVVDKGMSVLEGAAWPACVNGILKSALQGTAEPAAIKITGATTSFLNVTPLLDKTIATRTRLGVSAAGRVEPVYADLIVMREGRVVVLLYFINARTPFDAGLELQLMTSAANRVTTARVS